MQTVKCVVVGDGCVGKTCLLASYTQNVFPEDHVPTVFDSAQSIESYRGSPVTLTLWDTAGQSDYDRLRQLSYPETNVFLICFAIDNRDSFENVQDRWVPEVRHHCPNVRIILLGTKVDLRSDAKTLERLCEANQKLVSFQEGTTLAKQIKAEQYLECSAKTRTGLSNVFKEVVQTALAPAVRTQRRPSISNTKICAQS